MRFVVIKAGKFLVGFVAADAVLTAFGANKTTYAVVFATGVALICIGRIRGKLKRERESLNFRCRMRRKIAPSDSLARTGAIK